LAGRRFDFLRSGELKKKKKNQKKFWRKKKGFYLCRPENKGTAGDRDLERKQEAVTAKRRRVLCNDESIKKKQGETTLLIPKRKPERKTSNF